MNKKNHTKKTVRLSISGMTADLHKVTRRYVHMVVRGERTNEAILSTYRRLEAGHQDLMKQIEQNVNSPKTP